jgi:hypothetical protein
MLTALKRAYLHPEAQHKLWVNAKTLDQEELT